MIEDLERYKGTLLVWSALGGGSISLPFLEHEAYGEVDPRLRFYGFMNDSEFIAECNKRGIKVFGIVFEVQGWEFPVKIGKDGKSFEEFNVMRTERPHDWYGLREFTSNQHWEVFGKKFEDYFPNGLFNSDGERVIDLWEECCARTYEGKPVHADWVEVVGHKQIAYQMCRNNPVWREYLKKIIEIQIDAGVAGVQLDECELPMTSIGWGGCFCKDCMKQFREYLKELKAKGDLPAELESVDLDTFHYGEYLKERNIPFPGKENAAPLYKQYWDFQLRAIKKYFLELVDHAKNYARAKGREVLVSGNFFNLMPSYYPLEVGVDVVISEMKRTLFRQSYWYRYAAGFAGDKPIVIVENPYGGIIPELVEMLEDGKGHDLYRLFLLEASAYGCNMAVPYGAWMGNTIKTAFYPPRKATEEVQSFLTNNEHLFSKRSGAGVVVLYSYPSNYWREAIAGYSNSLVVEDERDLLSYITSDLDDPDTSRLPFWEVLKNLSDRQVSYDVKLIADDVLREDNFDIKDLEGYDLVILPGCDVLTPKQADVLEKYARQGHKLLIFGAAGKNLNGWFEKIKDMDNVVYCPDEANKAQALAAFNEAFERIYEDLWKVKADARDIGIQMHAIQGGTAIHILNYRYSKEEDRVLPIDKLTLKIRGTYGGEMVKVHTLDGRAIPYETATDGDAFAITLYEVPIYTVIELSRN